MMTPPAALRPHLLSEVTNSSQFRHDFDALLRLAISGKVSFHRFVNTTSYNFGIAHDCDKVFLKAATKDDNGVFRLFGPKVGCSQTVLDTFSNFVRVIDIDDVWGSAVHEFILHPRNILPI